MAPSPSTPDRTMAAEREPVRFGKGMKKNVHRRAPAVLMPTVGQKTIAKSAKSPIKISKRFGKQVLQCSGKSRNFYCIHGYYFFIVNETHDFTWSRRKDEILTGTANAHTRSGSPTAKAIGHQISKCFQVGVWAWKNHQHETPKLYQQEKIRLPLAF
jgi:hypothetical protein